MTETKQNRRTFLKTVGVAAGGAATVGTGLSSEHVVEEGEAIAPLIIGGAIAGAAVVGWAVREYEVVGSNPPAEGLTAGALKQDVYETARTRKSTNASTFVDNRNIINSGLENSLYVDGKVAAIEALNAQKSQSEVLSAAKSAFKKYAATVQSNFLKSWNESVNEFEKLVNTVKNHSEVSAILGGPYAAIEGFVSSSSFSLSDRSVTLADGTSFSVRQIANQRVNNNGHDRNSTWDVAQSDSATDFSTSDADGIAVKKPSGGKMWYLNWSDWHPVWSDLQDTISSVETGLQNWVSTIYSDVQSGDINVSELITPRERAEMMSEGGAAAQAIADLQALNVPIDVEHTATITMQDTNATLHGTMALTDDSQTIATGETYNPSADTFSGTAFFTYNVAEGEGEWSAYEEGVDGGVATFTSEPYEQTTFSITTQAGEVVDVTASDFTPVDSSGNEVTDPTVEPAAWEVDLSSKLDTAITNITGVKFYASSSETQYETINLNSAFKVDSITGEGGKEVDSLSFENAEAQTDSNYITQEEWDQMEAKNKELVEKYEASQNSGGGGIDLGQFDAFGVPGELLVGAVGITGAAFIAALAK